MTGAVKQKYRSWTDDEDLSLKDRVLEKVRYGQTQQVAFEEIANETDRSVGSVAFRWNNKVRKQYSNELKKAKEEYKKSQSKLNKQKNSTPEQTDKTKVKKNEDKIKVLVEVNPETSSSEKPKSPLSYDEVIEFINEKRELEEKFDSLNQSYQNLTIEHNNLKESFDVVAAAVSKVKN